MKIKKLLIPLLLLISCMFAFTACSNDTKFNFDENSTVKLTYTCEDEEKNFDAELTTELSRSFILSLNKITYCEVTDKDICFAPAYDGLTIKINNENISLFDVTYIMKYGGYFYYNGKLCQSKESFIFLGSYMVEYCPDIIPSSISFEVQYVKQTVGAKESCQIIKSVSGLNDYIATLVQSIDWPDFELFKDEVVSKYNDEYFENSFIVIFMKAASSGSFGFKVNDVSISRDRLIIKYEIVVPSDKDVSVTCDMAYWYSFVELSNKYDTVNKVDLISIQ